MRFKLKFPMFFLFASIFVSMACFAAPIEAKPNTMPVFISEQKVDVQAYNIKDENYFKLRDIAKAFEANEKCFEVLHSKATNAIYISTGASYTSVGGEMSPPSVAEAQQALPSDSLLYINGLAAKMTAYNINYNNYYRLKDLGAMLDFTVEYDAKNNTVLVDCPPLEPIQPPSPIEPPKPKSKTIMIDAGHGGEEPGSQNKGEAIEESLINYDVAYSLYQKLTAAGYDVVMLRQGRNETLSLTKRMEIIRNAAPHLLVSVHHNASKEHNVYGAEVLAQVSDKNGGKTKRLAELIGREYIKIGQTMRPTVFKYNSAKTGDYYGLLRAAAAVGTPAIISEFAFLDHPNDIDKINSPLKLELEADALFRAVVNYLAEYPPAK